MGRGYANKNGGVQCSVQQPGFPDWKFLWKGFGFLCRKIHIHVR